MPRLQQVASFFFVVIGALHGVRAAAVEASRVFKSGEHGFSVRYPASWNLAVLSDVFYIENFPPERAVNAVRLPHKGAGIKILVSDQIVASSGSQPHTLEEWVAIGAKHKVVVQRRSLDLAIGSEVIPAIEIRTKCCVVPPFQQSAEFYFVLDDRMFVGSAVFWMGDPDEGHFVAVLKEVIQSLKADP